MLSVISIMAEVYELAADFAIALLTGENRFDASAEKCGAGQGRKTGTAQSGVPVYQYPAERTAPVSPMWPIRAYFRGGAISGSCSASTTSQPL
jgi:hypothetical protein